MEEAPWEGFTYRGGKRRADHRLKPESSMVLKVQALNSGSTWEPILRSHIPYIRVKCVRQSAVVAGRNNGR